MSAASHSNDQGSDPNGYKHWSLTTDTDGIVWLAIDRADERVNTLGEELLAELDQVLDHLAGTKPTGMVVYSAKSAGFIAGADIREFEGLSLIHI